MAEPQPRSTATEVSNELNGEIAASDISDRILKRANRIVEKRLPDEGDAWLLKELEILVAAHLLYPQITGDTKGKRRSSIREGDAQVSYDTSTTGDIEGPGGYYSPYWMQAVELDERIEHEPFSSYTL